MPCTDSQRPFWVVAQWAPSTNSMGERVDGPTLVAVFGQGIFAERDPLLRYLAYVPPSTQEWNASVERGNGPLAWSPPHHLGHRDLGKSVSVASEMLLIVEGYH